MPIINQLRRQSLYLSNLQRLTRMKKVLRITNPNVYAAYVNVEDNGELITRKGWVLLWSPELTQGTAWEKKMEGYGIY